MITEKEKSISTHRDPKSLVQRLGGSTKEPPSGALKMGFSEDYREIRKRYAKSLHEQLYAHHLRRQPKKATLEKLGRVFAKHFSAAYAEGLRSQGVAEDRSIRDIVKEFGTDDKRHIRTMVSEELKYVGRFLSDMDNQNLKVPYEQRFLLYVQGLDGVYTGGRIAAIPEDVLLYWVGPKDKRKCLSCTYLTGASPFLPDTLPTTPRAGDTLCLGNCRDRIVAYQASPAEVRNAKRGYSKRVHRRNLSRIKRDRGKLSEEDVVAMAHASFKRRGKSRAKPPKPAPPSTTFYRKTPTKGRPTGLDYLRRQQQRRTSESMENETMNSNFQRAILIEDKGLQKPTALRTPSESQDEINEGLVRALKSRLTRVRKAMTFGNIWRLLKTAAHNVDVSSIYLVVAVQRLGEPEFLYYGTFWKMRKWISEMNKMHKQAYGDAYDLRWRIVGVSSKVEDAARHRLPHTGPAVHIEDPRDLSMVRRQVDRMDAATPRKEFRADPETTFSGDISSLSPAQASQIVKDRADFNRIVAQATAQYLRHLAASAAKYGVPLSTVNDQRVKKAATKYIHALMVEMAKKYDKTGEDLWDFRLDASSRLRKYKLELRKSFKISFKDVQQHQQRTARHSFTPSVKRRRHPAGSLDYDDEEEEYGDGEEEEEYNADVSIGSVDLDAIMKDSGLA